MFLVCRKVLYICIMYVYDLDMRVMWDPQKAKLNHKKHGFASLMPRRCSLIPTHLQERMMNSGQATVRIRGDGFIWPDCCRCLLPSR